MRVYTWQKFHQTNNTFQELTNSGNLSLISNDSIKTNLQNLESLYKLMKAEEDHYRYDAETLIYGPLYEIMDLNPLIQSHVFELTGGKAGSTKKLNRDEFDIYIKNKKLKNGFVMASLEFGILNSQFQEMIQLSEVLIEQIETEIQTK